MKWILVLFLFSENSFAAGFECVRKESSAERSGRIVYSIGGEHCVGESCFQQSFKESDRCFDNKTLLKMICGKVEPQEVKVPCPNFCSKGLCQ